ncbi:MAG TPA: secondary thiamine-phosphate synthase enzyme YjbQ [Vicinamibacteria bacterium]|nr:secondary thiamine-phosphate synthase enzyme YjbQ [Vicinamibacteria bacterium]
MSLVNVLNIHDSVELDTEKRIQFIDLTGLVRERVRASEVVNGMVNVQTKHTTTAIVLNENEHQLLRDFEERLEAWAPRGVSYYHNDLEARRFQLRSDERPNGDAHARAILLGASETLNVVDGEVQLGPWQRLFLVELDGPRRRSISILVMGTVV